MNTGIANAINNLPQGIKGSKEAVAETIENNIRSKIIKEHLRDPAYFEEMSKLLDEVIKFRKANADKYEEYLKMIAETAKMANNVTRDDFPAGIQTYGQQVLYNNLDKNATLAIKIHEGIERVKKADWKGNRQKENEIKAVLYKILEDEKEVERIFPIIKENKEF